FIVTFSSFSGFLGHVAEGRIDVTLAVLAVVAVLLGSQLGAWFMANKARPGWVRKLYGIVLLGVAAKLLHGVCSD
ncbi:MAG TPA: sulfite exporter TauE/SafE family protein, partial [Chromatiales bacterium]|nr:sulfite exporter TauE/SafE family protein [Chromatiales bacterium]